MNKMGGKLLRCSPRTSTEAVRGDLGWETMSGRRMSRRISWWGKVVQMKRDRWVRRIYDFERAQLDRDPNTQNWCNLTKDWMYAVGLGECWVMQRPVKPTEAQRVPEEINHLGRGGNNSIPTPYSVASSDEESSAQVRTVSMAGNDGRQAEAGDVQTMEEDPATRELLEE